MSKNQKSGASGQASAGLNLCSSVQICGKATALVPLCGIFLCAPLCPLWFKVLVLITPTFAGKDAG
jgi:hypothetical protein